MQTLRASFIQSSSGSAPVFQLSKMSAHCSISLVPPDSVDTCSVFLFPSQHPGANYGKTRSGVVCPSLQMKTDLLRYLSPSFVATQYLF